LSEFHASISFLTLHLRPAAYAALVFTLGLLSSITVVKYRIEVLLAFPRWLSQKLPRMLSLSALPMLLIIFGFNSTAILLYMLTGAAHYLAPVFIAFMTGTHIGIISILAMGASAAPPAAQEQGMARRRFALLCGLLTGLLELPCFWLAIGMGMTLGGFGAPVDDLAAMALVRLSVYARMIAPVLFLSAAIETIGIKLMDGGEKKEGGP